MKKKPFGLGPEDDVAYCRFILKKKRIDTLMAAGIIADYLKIPLRNVSWAGIKDGRALTSQLCVKGNQYSKLKTLIIRILIYIVLDPQKPFDRKPLGKLFSNQS